MNNEELKAALISGRPITYNNEDGNKIRYDRVSAIIYRYSRKQKRVVLSAELLDVNKNSILICGAENIEEAT